MLKGGSSLWSDVSSKPSSTISVTGFSFNVIDI
jgi:hypothetical protein